MKKNKKVIYVDFRKRKPQRRINNPFYIIAPFVLILYSIMLVMSVLIIGILK